MKTIMLLCVALVVLVASEASARPSEPSGEAPPVDDGGRAISRAAGVAVGEDASSYSETGAKSDYSYGVAAASASRGIAISQSQSHSQD